MDIDKRNIMTMGICMGGHQLNPWAVCVVTVREQVGDDNSCESCMQSD